MIHRCKRCGIGNNRTSINQQTGLCLDCQPIYELEQQEINNQKELKRAEKEKDFYKF